MQNIKILVTWGAGFLRSHLCKKLINQGHHVTAIDNLYTGSLQNEDLIRIDKLISPFKDKLFSRDIFHEN